MSAAVETLRGYVALTKPRILLLVIFTGLPVMLMGSGAWPGASGTFSAVGCRLN